MGFDPYKEDRDKRSCERIEEVKSTKEMFARKHERFAKDPIKKIFASQKGGQERKRRSGKTQVSLPTLQFLKDTE